MRVPFWRQLLAASGPGYVVAVGYMDPGNWATGIAAGSAYGTSLLCVVFAASLVGILFQNLAGKLGVVSGLDLAQGCRARYHSSVRRALWLLCELAIIACDIAEVIGAAVALKLLFSIPLAIGIVLTGFQVLFILALQGRGFRRLEAIVISLIAIISCCFVFELWIAAPDLSAALRGLVPRSTLVTDPGQLYLSIGIIGATVMPHNLYLYSSLVRQRSFASRREALTFSRIDIVVSLSLAFLVNAAILILASSAFHDRGHGNVAGIEEAFYLLAPTLGVGVASTLFAVALLAAGQSSAITGTMAGQVVMEGFTNLRWAPWVRRFVSRALAIGPAMAAVLVYGDEGATKLLVFSQVVLTLQLPFALVPLICLTSDKRLMGQFANNAAMKSVAWTVTGGLIAVNGILLWTLC